MKRIRRVVSVLSVLFVLSLVACGGGGGSGGGGGGRTTKTGVRLIHAAIGVAPLDVRLGEEFLQRAKYAQLTEFVEVPEGQQSISLQRANSTGPSFRVLPLTLAPVTEYTIFLYGGAGSDTDNVTVLTEPIERPEPGFARIQFLNGYESGRSMDVTSPALSESLGAQFGGGSGFRSITSGVHEFSFGLGGSEVGRLNVEIPDRGELTLVASGSGELGFRQFRAYIDLD